MATVKVELTYEELDVSYALYNYWFWNYSLDMDYETFLERVATRCISNMLAAKGVDIYA